jgi:translation initiation factor 2 subunit 3
MENLNLKEIMQYQPIINIGMIGSVSNGKSSVTEKLTMTRTQKHSIEEKKNITIKLGYANTKIYKCSSCQPPSCYQQQHSDITVAYCRDCSQQMELIKHISIIDVPGHNLLMATMLNGTCVMDATILVEAANNNPLPAPQTTEHLLATKMIHLKNSITCFNKFDLVKREVALNKIKSLTDSLKNTMADNSPIIPISANHGLNIDVLCQYICTYIKDPEPDFHSHLKMIIIRSFNINHQDTDINLLEGGVIGGTIIKGILKKNDKIIIYPGLVMKNNDSSTNWNYKPLIARVQSINSETNNLEFAIPGGLIGIKLDIDPALAAKDGLVGNMLTSYDPDNQDLKIFETIYVLLELLDRPNFTEKLSKKDILIINSNACNSKCEIIKIKKEKAELKLLEKPICACRDDYITLSKVIGNHSSNHMVVIGRALIVDGIESNKIN